MPLGGIKTPFNFDCETDYYTTKGESIFHCYSINGDRDKFKEFVGIVEKKFGDLNYQIGFGENIEFFFNLIKEDKMKELEEFLTKFGGAYVCKFFSIFFLINVFLDTDETSGQQYYV